jgi:TolA-binding protein
MSLPPRRLLDSPPDASEEDRLLARYLKAVPEPAPLSTAAVERVSRELQAPPRLSLLGHRALWGLVLAAPLALAGAWWLLAAPEAPSALVAEDSGAEPLLESAPPDAVMVPHAVEAATPSDRMELAAEVRSTPPKLKPSTVRPAQRIARAEPQRQPPPTPEEPAAAAVPAPDPLIEESRLLQAALHHLRTLKDGPGALLVLEQYEERFPQGQLRAEATLARVDALLLTGRASDALKQLQRLSPVARTRLPRARELQVLEVELLAQLGRCDQALVQLKQLSDSGPVLAERALFVHATCEARSQRFDQARALYEELLRKWPDGAHAAEARRALGKTP